MHVRTVCTNSFQVSIFYISTDFCITCGKFRETHSEVYIEVNTRPDTVGESTDFKCPRLMIVNTYAVVTLVLTIL